MPCPAQDRAIFRMGCIRVRPGRLYFQKIISLQNQNITEYQDCNWLAQVSVVQARDSWFSAGDVIVDQITPKPHRKTPEKQKTTPASTIGTCSLVISVLFPVQPLYYVPYKTLILPLEPPESRLVQQTRTYGSLQCQLLVFTVTLSNEQQLKTVQ